MTRIKVSGPVKTPVLALNQETDSWYETGEYEYAIFAEAMGTDAQVHAVSSRLSLKSGDDPEILAHFKTMLEKVLMNRMIDSGVWAD